MFLKHPTQGVVCVCQHRGLLVPVLPEDGDVLFRDGEVGIHVELEVLKHHGHKQIEQDEVAQDVVRDEVEVHEHATLLGALLHHACKDACSECMPVIPVVIHI